MLLLVDGPPLLAAALDRVLAQEAAALEVAPEARRHERVRVEHLPGEGLDRAEDFHGVFDGAEFVGAETEDAERDPEERLAALVEEHVPDAAAALDGEAADEAAHEPAGRREAHGGEPVGLGGGGRGRDAVGAVVEFDPEAWFFVLEGAHQDTDVDVGTFECEAVRAGEVFVGEDAEKMEGAFFVAVEREEEEPGEEVERLTVADARLMDGKGTEDTPQFGDHGSLRSPGRGAWCAGRRHATRARGIGIVRGALEFVIIRKCPI